MPAIVPAAHPAMPARHPLPLDDGTAHPADESAQVLADPPRAPGPDGWTPATVVAVHSQNPQGFVGSALNFALGGTHERPGQRLSTAQIDAIAPHFAATFHVDEQFVRDALAKVYVYVGGPASGGSSAMTIGHHIFVPDERSLEHIVSPGGSRWLVHELAHTMQFLTYGHSNNYRFLASYFKSMVVGIDPQQPGSGSGPLVWGAAFTGWRTRERSDHEIGAPSMSVQGRLGLSVLPAATVGVPLSLAAAGSLTAARRFQASRAAPEALRSINILGRGNSLATTAALIGGPLVAGSVAGLLADHTSRRTAQVIGGGAGAGIAIAALVRGGAFAGIGSGRLALGLTAGHLFAATGVVAAAALGVLSATTTANSIAGWSKSAPLLRRASAGGGPDPALADTVHDSHWEEIDAEAIAQEFVRTRGATVDTSPYEGVRPAGPGTLRDRIDWGLWNPLILGIPAAGVVGTGVLTARTGITLLDDTVRRGATPLQAVRNAIHNLGTRQRGVGNSLGVGAALTLAPLVVGGTVGPLADRVGAPRTLAPWVGAGAASLVSGALLTMLLHGNGSSLVQTTPKVLAGMAVAGAVGLLGASAAVNASHPVPRSYDVSHGSTAHA